MRKRSQKQTIFSNDDHEETVGSLRGNRKRGERSEVLKPKLQAYDYPYTFKDFLKLSLAKILPRNDLITFVPEKQLILGE